MMQERSHFAGTRRDARHRAYLFEFDIFERSCATQGQIWERLLRSLRYRSSGRAQRDLGAGNGGFPTRDFVPITYILVYVESQEVSIRRTQTINIWQDSNENEVNWHTKLNLTQQHSKVHLVCRQKT